MLTLVLFSPMLAQAQNDWFEKNYVLAAPQFSSVDLKVADSSAAGLSLAFGTEIHPQWYAEIGYSVMTNDFDSSGLTTVSASEGDNAGVNASGLYLAFLGKAEGRSGELFYKLGVMTIDYESAYLVSGNDTCSTGAAQTGGVVPANTTLCSADDTAFAGIIGAGFDFFVSYRSQVRLNVEHIRGDNDVQANTLHLGYRYNF